jgi:hypothetical protein
MRDQRRDNRSPRRDYPRRDNRSQSRIDNRSPQRYGHGREYMDSRDMRKTRKTRETRETRESGVMPHEIFNDRRRIPRDFTNDRIMRIQLYYYISPLYLRLYILALYILVLYILS